jgi:serine protease Do
MKLKFSQSFWILIAAIIVGGLSGILGFIIVGAGNFKIPFVGKLDYGNSNLDQNIVIEQPRSVVIEQDTQINQIENNVLPAIINLYHTKKSTDPLSAAYIDKELLGRGVMLTADGWIISTASVIDNLKTTYAAVGYQNKKYDLKPVVADSATGLVFAKVDVANLPVVKFGKSSDLHIGQTVVAIGGKDELMVVNISKIGYKFGQSKDLVLNSDVLNKKIYLDHQLSEAYDGGVLVNFKGEVVGIISGGVAIPADNFNNIISGVLSNKKVARASLKLDYIDLAQVDGLISFAEKGAYVAYEPLKATTAFGIIKKGDIIKKVNDIELNAFVGLSEAINQYNMGDKVEILLSRDGKDMTVSVTLL